MYVKHRATCSIYSTLLLVCFQVMKVFVSGFSPLPLGWGGVGLGGVKAASTFPNLILVLGKPAEHSTRGLSFTFLLPEATLFTQV